MPTVLVPRLEALAYAVRSMGFPRDLRWGWSREAWGWTGHMTGCYNFNLRKQKPNIARLSDQKAG